MSVFHGKKLNLSIFGQSHGEAVGIVIEGLPAGGIPDMNAVSEFMARRSPGSSSLVSARHEADVPRILSGLYNGRYCDAPLCAIIENTDVKSADYERIADIPRPMHADFPAAIRSGGFNDPRGGGQFSARLTAPFCFAGALCMQLLEHRGIHIAAHLFEIGGVKDTPMDPMYPDVELLKMRDFPTISFEAEAMMKRRIEQVREEGDSIGGIIECAAVGLPAGIGDAMFGGLESLISSIVFSIPAVKGIEFGAGFSAASMLGSEHNDAFFTDGNRVFTETNNHGGILGGISTGMPLTFRAAFKPTPSIGKAQNSVSLSKLENTSLHISGRHDPCVALRAVPCVEAALAIALYDVL